MMRIKEAILRKKIIQQLNDEWKEEEDAAASAPPVSPLPQPSGSSKEEADGDSGFERDLHPLLPFVHELMAKLTDLQKRALKVTWKRLSEAPKTSGRGTIQIMERILDKLIEAEPSVPSLFYKSAFLSCIEDRRCCRSQSNERRWAKTIATLRDHAQILVTFIDAIIQLMFEGTTTHTDIPDPETIGMIHNRLYPLGFTRRMWQVLGECFAEVFFMQDCVRAYPHAASAWSLLCVTFTDRMYAACKPTSTTASSIAASASSHQFPSDLAPPTASPYGGCPKRSTSRPLELPTSLRYGRCPVVVHLSRPGDSGRGSSSVPATPDEAGSASVAAFRAGGSAGSQTDPSGSPSSGQPSPVYTSYSSLVSPEHGPRGKIKDRRSEIKAQRSKSKDHPSPPPPSPIPPPVPPHQRAPRSKPRNPSKHYFLRSKSEVAAKIRTTVL